MDDLVKLRSQMKLVCISGPCDKVKISCAQQDLNWDCEIDSIELGYSLTYYGVDCYDTQCRLVYSVASTNHCRTFFIVFLIFCAYVLLLLAAAGLRREKIKGHSPFSSVGSERLGDKTHIFDPYATCEAFQHDGGGGHNKEDKQHLGFVQI